MIVLDENLDVWQRQRLDSWGIHFRRIGGEIGRFGMDDTTRLSGSFTLFAVQPSSRAIKIFTVDG